MSKPRYDWWPYVKGMIRRYPTLKERYADLHSTALTSNYSGMPRSSEASRTTEITAIRELPTNSQREYEAVRHAIEATERYSNGRDRLRAIEMVYWKQSHTLYGVALTLQCSFKTARKWHGEFIRTTAAYYGLMDGE